MKMATMATALLMALPLVTAVGAEEAKPLKALLITGGGYHDYNTQKKILTEGISARANVQWTVVLENPAAGELPKVFADPDWAQGYDVVVHNQCFAQYRDDAEIERIVKDHLDAEVAVVMIHCAMHAFRDAKTKEWDKLVGVESRRHGPHFPITVRNLAPEHPITRQTPPTWTTPKGELYHTSILPSATKLAVGFKEGEEAQTSQVCVWTNRYGPCRTFGTTLGHHNETMQEKGYLDLVSNGLLWACGKLDESGQPLPGYGKTAAGAAQVEFQVVAADGAVQRLQNLSELARTSIASPSPACCHP